MSADNKEPIWRKWTRPIRIISTSSHADVGSCLQEIEQETKQGAYAVGWISAEAAAAFESGLALPAQDDFPLLHFALYDSSILEAPQSNGTWHKSDWKPDTNEQEYREALESIHEQIRRGHTYQTNFTLRLDTSFSGDALAYFQHLTRAQPTSYTAYIDTGRWQILSVSPELFFRKTEDTIITRPMKGTIHRGATHTEDMALRSWLTNSEKNRAENIMIVDLLRNDLGKIARFGSVQVTDLCQVETYPTLHTMTSTIQAKTDASLLEIITALFPCGSVTGAPKIKTQQIIRELEKSPRRIYCGAIGIIEPNGNTVFNVPIRTVLIDSLQQTASYGVGGGITWDSQIEEEYAEVMTKAKVVYE